MGYLDSTGLAHLWGKIKAALAGKQSTLTGTAGQVVGFDEGGNAVAQDAPQSGGMTQEDADARYLKLSGGTMNGAIKFSTSMSGGGLASSRLQGSAQNAFIRVGENLSGYPCLGFSKVEGTATPIRLNGVAAPVHDNDAASKQYVDEAITTAVGDGSSGGEVYSAEETRIGTWVDGKNIYRSILTINNNGGSYVSIPVENVEHILRYYGWGRSRNLNYELIIPAPSSYLRKFGTEAFPQFMLESVSDFANSPVTLVIEYTKTTD